MSLCTNRIAPLTLVVLLALPAGAMINGSPAPDDDQVGALLGYSSGSGWVFCSGTLVTPYHVLTAAHCIDQLDIVDAEGDIYVFFTAEPYTDGWDDSVPVRQATRHPDWDDGDWVHDIAIVQLQTARDDEPVVLNDLDFGEHFADSTLEFVGYGQTGNTVDDEGRRQTTDIAVSYCTSGPNDGDTGCADGNAFLAHDEATNLCAGDSGGPAFATFDGHRVQVGVSSWVEPDCEGGSTGATRVDRYKAWLDDEIDDLVWLSDVTGEEPADPDPDDDGDDPSDERTGCTTASGPSALWLAALLALAGRRVPRRGPPEGSGR